ncbi:MAG: hypothetical protein Q9159_007071 [Coniocarpon cinnabarinum]
MNLAITTQDLPNSTKVQKVRTNVGCKLTSTDSVGLLTGWKCCKPRVLTFEEFLEIPPCTVGKHSVVDDTPQPPPKENVDVPQPQPQPISNGPPVEAPIPTPSSRVPAGQPNARTLASPAPAMESDSDELDGRVTPKANCKRRGCGFQAPADTSSYSRDNEKCVYHAGQPIFHEGSKGWTCCKKRVLEFDEFMKIQGCKERPRHCFVGKKVARRSDGWSGDEYEKVESVRNDFYQTANQVHASLYLKKIDKEKSHVAFADATKVQLDLKTTDRKRYQGEIPLYGRVEPSQCQFTIKGTKLDLMLAKADGLGWPVLRADEDAMGQIIQSGKAGVAPGKA